jgi:hypothetical protein
VYGGAGLELADQIARDAGETFRGDRPGR